jgi:mono/diheme cytochrome c family protein
MSRRTLLLALAALFAVAGCRQDMHDQAKYEPFERNPFFDDQRSSRALIEGTVARGQGEQDSAFYHGMADGAVVETIPLAIDRALLERGQDRFNIYCSPCHDRVGTGNGMIVQRGYKQPVSFHEPRLRGIPDGYFFQAITNGFGVMPSYAAQVPVRDRWAIVAYIRALQLSQSAEAKDLTDGDLSRLATIEAAQ